MDRGDPPGFGDAGFEEAEEVGVVGVLAHGGEEGGGVGKGGGRRRVGGRGKGELVGCVGFVGGGYGGTGGAEGVEREEVVGDVVLGVGC